LVLEAASAEGVELGDGIVVGISSVVVVGFSEPNLSVHRRLFEICRMLSALKPSEFFLHRLINEMSNEMSFDAMRRAIQAVAMVPESDVKLLLPLSFAEVALSSVPQLWIFYLSSFGHFLAKTANTEREQTVWVAARRNLLKIVLKCDVDSDFGYLPNAAALLLSLCSGVHDFVKTQIFAIIAKLLRKIAASDDLSAAVQMIGVFSAMSHELLDTFLPLFTTRSVMIQRTVLFTLREFMRENTFQPFLPNTNHLQNGIYAVLHACLLVIMKKGRPRGGEYGSQLMLFVNDAMVTIAEVCRRIFVPRPKTFLFINGLGQFSRNLFASDKWFVFLWEFAITCHRDLRPAVFDALDAWLRICEIPQGSVSLLERNLEDLAVRDVRVPGLIFQTNPEKFIGFFIRRSRSGFWMFAGLIAQMNFPTEFRFDPIDLTRLRVFYQNSGQLISLALFHMLSSNVRERMQSADFLKCIVLIISIVRQDPSALKIIQYLEELRPHLQSSFSVFLKNDFSLLNHILGQHFQFTADTFVGQCFEFCEPRLFGTGSLGTAQRRLSSTNTGPHRSTIRSHSNSVDKRLSVLHTCDSALGLLLPSNISRVCIRPTYPDDNVKVDRFVLMGSLISAWVTPISLTLDDFGLSSKCDPEFRRFGIVWFIERVVDLCDSHGLTHAISQIVDIVITEDPRLRIICLLTSSRHDEARTRSAKYLLLYSFNRCPTIFLEIFSEYLRITAWLFHEIHRVALDELVELVEQGSRIGDNGGDSQTDYYVTLNFVVELFEDCLRENRNAFAPILTQLLIFCIIHRHRFEDCANRLIAEITGLRPATGSGSSSLPFVQPQNDEWPLDQVAGFIDNPSDRYLLEWGLCYGDLITARCALEIFQIKGKVVDSRGLQAVLRSMQIVSSALSERTDPAKKQQFDQWLVRVVVDGSRPQYAETLDYLQTCLAVVKRYVKVSQVSSAAVFWAAMTFLKAPAAEYNKLFVSAIEMIAVFVKKPRLCEELHSADHGGNLLRLMFAVQCDDLTTIICVFDIVQALLTVRLVGILGSDPSAVYLAVFALIPALWNRYKTSERADDLATTLSHVADLPTVKRWLSDVAFSERRSPRSIAEVVTILLPRINEDEIQLLLSFLGQVVKFGTPFQREASYAIAQSILILSPEAKVDFAAIGSCATLDTDLHASPIVKGLLRVLVERGIIVRRAARLSAGKVWSIFPAMKLEFEIGKWQPPDGDVFEEYEKGLRLLHKKFNEECSSMLNGLLSMFDVCGIFFTFSKQPFALFSDSDNRKLLNERSVNVRVNWMTTLTIDVPFLPLSNLLEPVDSRHLSIAVGINRSCPANRLLNGHVEPRWHFPSGPSYKNGQHSRNCRDHNTRRNSYPVPSPVGLDSIDKKPRHSRCLSDHWRAWRIFLQR
jgi:hypothetical protein